MLSLQRKLNQVSKVFNIDKVLSRGTTQKDIAKYYKTNIIPYLLFHNKDGFVHMGLSSSNYRTSEDVLEQPKLVAKYIDTLKATKVLELASGKGASSIYLAKKYTNVAFSGIDLPNGQIEVAKKNTKKLVNFDVYDGDYHNLSLFADNSMDIVFIIEALCHSDNKEIVAKEVNRVLRPNGVFIVIDGYLARPIINLTDTQIEAKKLTEKGMAVNNFEVYENVKTKIEKEGFTLEYEENATNRIMPNLKRFEQYASAMVFTFTPLGRILAALFPADFTYNAVSGYLMPNLLEEGVACYYITVFRKL